MQRGAQQLFHLALERWRQRRAARIRKAQPRGQRRVGAAQGLQQLGVHGGHALDDGQSIVFQCGQQAIDGKARHQVQRGARIQGTQGHRGQAVHMRNRQHAPGAVAARQAAQGAGDGGDEQQVAVRQHHAFRLARGARRVDQRGHLFVAGDRGFRDGCVVRLARQQLAHAVDRGAGRAQTCRMCGRFRRGAGQEQQPPRRAVACYAVDLARRQPCIDVDDPRVDAGASEDQRHLQRAVLAHHHQAVAGAHVQLAQQLRGAFHTVLQLRVGPAAASFMQRRCVRRARRPVGGNGRQARRQAGQQGGNVHRGLLHFCAALIMLRAMTICWICVVPS